MKRPLKITLVSLGSVLGLIILALAVVSVILFSGKNLASVVRSQLNKQDQIEFTLDKADLVFFRTFPEVSIHVENFGMKTLPSKDNLLQADDLYAALDLKAFLFRDELKIRKVSVDGVSADVTRLMESFSSSEEKVEEEESAPFEMPFGLIDASMVSASDVNVTYKEAEGIDAQVEGLSLKVQLNTRGEKISGKLQLDIPAVSCALKDTVYCTRLPLVADLNFQADLDSMAFLIENAHLKIDQFPLTLSGKVGIPEEGKIDTDLMIGLDDWNVARVLELIPEAYRERVEGIVADGHLTLKAQAKGQYAEKSMPLLTGTLALAQAGFHAPFLPVAVDQGDLDLTFSADLNEAGNTDVHVSSLSVLSGSNEVSLSGDVRDVMGNPRFDVKVASALDLLEIMPILPDSLGVDGSGKVNLKLDVKGNLAQITEQQLDRIKASGSLQLQDLELQYQDTISLKAKDLNLDLALNSPAANDRGYRNEVLLSTSSLDMNMGESISGFLSNAGLNVSLKELPLGGKPLELYCDFDIDSIQVQADTIKAAVMAPKGMLAMLPSLREGGQGRILCKYDSEAIAASMGNQMSIDTRKIAIDASADMDTTAKGVLAQWQPEVAVNFQSGNIETSMFPDPVHIPAIEFTYAQDTLSLKKGSFAMGRSDFDLSGVISDIQKAMRKEGLLNATLNFVSDYADVDQLLSYFSGMGNEAPEEGAAPDVRVAELSQDAQAAEQAEEGDPFMVPKGINLTLNTNIKKALALGNAIENVGGEVTIDDGVAVLRQLGFTSDAAKMQLTAMYKSPRRNHLFVGLDFHLIDIEIDKLIQMVPKVDSLVPMLKSFAGQAEFHLALETNLNSKYELKKSTILGAAAIEGKNLVVLDSETFDTIAKMMMFKKSSKNVIDSLEVDLTVFRDEIDIYPFVVSMDNYKVILSGRHNLDMSFNYHLDCVSPIRLGLDVKGSLGNLKFGLTPTRYRNLFKPERRNDLQERTFKLMNLINSSLKESVVEQ